MSESTGRTYGDNVARITTTESVSDTSKSIASIESWSDESDIEVSRTRKRTKPTKLKERPKRPKRVPLHFLEDSSSDGSTSDK